MKNAIGTCYWKVEKRWFLYKEAKALAKLCPSVLWMTELASDEIVCLAGNISKQSVEGAAWFLLTAESKMWQERDNLKTELLSKKELDLEIWKILSLSILGKQNKKLFWREHKDVAKQPFDKEITGMTHEFNQPP